MADFYPYSALPGQSAATLTSERWCLWYSATWYLLKGVQISSAAADAGNTPTTELRHGLLMGQIAATGQFTHYQPNAVDGSQLCVGPLWEARKVLDTDGNAVSRIGQVVVAGPVRGSQLFLLDEQARSQMVCRFQFDDRLVYNGAEFFQAVPKTANYTVVAGTDSGTHFTTTGNAGAITFTLPAVAKGNRFRFTNVVGQNMTLTGPAGSLVTFNNAAATSVAFTTAGNLIGASVDIVSDETGAKWIVMPRGANTMTVS